MYMMSLKFDGTVFRIYLVGHFRDIRRLAGSVVHLVLFDGNRQYWVRVHGLDEFCQDLMGR